MNDEEVPGGTAGCDVCGVLLAPAMEETHIAWHRVEEERLDQLAEAIEGLHNTTGDSVRSA